MLVAEVDTGGTATEITISPFVIIIASGDSGVQGLGSDSPVAEICHNELRGIGTPIGRF